MNRLGFGENMPSSGAGYLQVKNAKEQVQFRIAQTPAYSGKHFFQLEEGWDIQKCPRINDQEECEYCELYFKAKAEEKKLKDTDAEAAKKWTNKAREYQVSVTFYFPILNRNTGKFTVLQTTQGVRNKINAIAETGVDVFGREFILMNTGSKVPNDKYSVTQVDSADVKPLSEDEEAELVKAQEYDMDQINDGASAREESD